MGDQIILTCLACGTKNPRACPYAIAEPDACDHCGSTLRSEPATAPIRPSPVDDAEIRAFIAGWNAKLAGEHDFDMALHWWMREQCGIHSAMDLFDAALKSEPAHDQ